MVVSHYGGDVTRANILPRRRAKILARWGADATPADTARRMRATPTAAAMSTVAQAYRCPDCGYTYDERVGHPREGFPPGTQWSGVPEDWNCPDCGVRDKIDFVPVELVGAA